MISAGVSGLGMTWRDPPQRKTCNQKGKECHNWPPVTSPEDIEKQEVMQKSLSGWVTEDILQEIKLPDHSHRSHTH